MIMKIRIQFLVLAVSLASLPGILQAQPSAHYVPGAEGIKGASLPPPGFYIRDYNYFYWADQLNNSSGNKEMGINAFVYANIPRFIWITDTKFLGGYVGVDGFLPVVYQHLAAGGYDNSTFGIDDLYGAGSLSWHTKQFDFAIASGVYAPTGDSPTRPPPALSTRIGLGYWTFMQTAAATWYIDPEKTWAVSAVNRYEFNTEQRDTHITPGQTYSLDWGVSKTVAKVVDLGAAGYYQQQVTGSSTKAPLSRVAAVGPEVVVTFPDQMLFVSLRYNYEFMADSRMQGNAVTLTLTKRF